MNFKKYSILFIMFLFIWQSVVAQTTAPINNGRTAAQEARHQKVDATETRTTARNNAEDLGDEGQYADRINQAQAIDYGAINAQLQGFAEQYELMQLSNEQLQTELANIKKSLDICCGGGSSINNLTNGSSLEEEAPYLMQNAPNPFNEETSIQFFVPYNATIAKLQIRDLSGKIIENHQLEDRGLSDVKFSSKAFGSGSYIYTLEVDGQIKDSKIMILTK